MARATVNGPISFRSWSQTLVSLWDPICAHSLPLRVGNDVLALQIAGAPATRWSGRLARSATNFVRQIRSVLPAASLVGTVGGTNGTANNYAEHLHLGLFLSGARQDPSFLVSAPLAAPGATSTNSPTGDPMTDIIYYAYTGTGTGASASTQGLKSPVTTVP